MGTPPRVKLKENGVLLTDGPPPKGGANVFGEENGK